MFTVLVFVSGLAVAQERLPSEAELDRRIRAHAQDRRRQDLARLEEIGREGDEALQRNQGRTYWSEEHVAAVRRSTGRPVTQIWSQAKLGRNGRYVKGSGGNIAYTDGGFFCKSTVPSSGAWFMILETCYEMDGTPLN